MKRVTGIGGIFFKSDHPEQLYAWYEKHLGLKRHTAQESCVLPSPPDDHGPREFYLSFFPRSTKYFEPSSASFMINYRVEDLDAVIAALHAEGIEIIAREDYDFGRFAWIMDPEGNRVELWQPAKPTTINV